MTEDELFKLETEVFHDTVSDPDMEREWLLEQQELFRKNEQQLMGLFRLSKYLRDDTQITASHSNLMRARRALHYIDKRLGELGSPVQVLDEQVRQKRNGK